MSIYVRDAAGNRQKIAGVGLPGPAGKSAYQYAVEGGFSGTEEEFRAVVGVRSNPNLLDNWYFADPINQRGQNVYTTIGFTIDRWFGFSDGETYPMRVEVTKTGLYFPNSNNGINQQFEPALDTKITYTFSFMEDTGEVYSSKIVPEEYIALNGTFFGLFYQGTALFFKPARGKKFIAVKLELGPVQTLAHKDASGNWVLNDPPPNKALELAKCQRYQLPLLDRSGNYGCPIGFGVFQNTLGRIIIPTPTTMRGTPTLTVLNGNISAFEIIDVSGTPHPVATITTQGKFSNGIYLGVTITDTIATSPSICALKYTSTGIPMLDSNL